MVARVSSRRRGHWFIQNSPKTPGGLIPSGGIVAGEGTFSDFSGEIVSPYWQRIDVVTIVGNAGHIELGNLIVDEGGDYVAELRAAVLHNWGKNIIFGLAVDGGQPIEIGRVQITSAELVSVVTRRRVTLTAGSSIAFYVTSDFAYADMSMTGGELMLVHL